MKRFFLGLLICGSVHAMQEHKQTQTHLYKHKFDHNGQVICVNVDDLNENIRATERRLSEERERRKYRNKKKIALITLATSIVGGITALVIYFTK